MPTIENRATMQVIVSNDGKWFHLGELMQLAGTNESTPTEGRVGGRLFDLWFPVGGDVFTTVEEVLQHHGIAHNLVSLEPKYQDFEATYNEKESAA
jgi:hypothetical protein